MVDYIKNEIYPAGQNLYCRTWGKHQMALFGAFVAGILLLGIIYIYFISAIVMQTVNRDHNIEKLGALEQEYQELEKDYLSLLSKFNLDYAYSLGFVSSGNASVFLARDARVAQNASYEKTVR